MVVILGVQDTDVSFLIISSNHTAYQKANQDVLRLKPILKSEGRPYLSHDSYVDCETPEFVNYKGFKHDEIKKVGTMSPEDLKFLRRTIWIESPTGKWSRDDRRLMGIDPAELAST